MENILTCIRIKPVQPDQIGDLLWDRSEDKSVVNLKSKEKYNFENVFDGSTHTQEIFTQIGSPLVTACLQGINVCIFAYGQTSSGKTHTMKGNQQDPGIIPQSLEFIFQKITDDKDFDYEVKVSYIEIYNENVYDLLNANNSILDIRENVHKGIHIPGLTETVVKSYKEAMDLFNKGETNRKFGETFLNDQSSRSHTILRVSFEMRNKAKPEKIIFSNLNLVDLAGSEGVSKAKTEGLRKREGSNINKSLLALSNVISKLSSKDLNFINYRDSKLTRLLQPYLGGNSRTIVVCTINPLMSDFQETINTIKFGVSAGAIKNQIKVNERTVSEKNSLSKESIRKELLKESCELNEVKTELNKHKELHDQMNEEYNTKLQELEAAKAELVEQNANLILGKQILSKEVTCLKERVAQLEDGNQKLKKDNEDLLQIVKDIENDTNRNFNAKAGELQKAFIELEKRLKEGEHENLIMCEENLRLKQEISKLESLRLELTKEKDQIITNSKDHITHLQKNIDVLKLEKASMAKDMKESSAATSVRNSNAMSLENTGRFVGGPALFQGFDQDDMQLKLLELETILKGQIIQKNKIINELNTKITELTRRNISTEEKLSSYENDGFNPKFQTPSVAGDDLSIGDTTIKKRKLDEYDHVSKKIKDTPAKDDLKREIKQLHNKVRNYEKQLQKKRVQEEEYVMRIQDIMRKNMELEYKINFVN